MENNIVPVIIEITTGSSNKYEYNFETKRIILDRVLYGANVYPAEYGCIENTLD
jgi:inorganic pyrophosphatase